MNNKLKDAYKNSTNKICSMRRIVNYSEVTVIKLITDKGKS